jgi:hypothetical protein
VFASILNGAKLGKFWDARKRAHTAGRFQIVPGPFGQVAGIYSLIHGWWTLYFRSLDLVEIGIDLVVGQVAFVAVERERLSTIPPHPCSARVNRVFGIWGYMVVRIVVVESDYTVAKIARSLDPC